MPQGRSISAQTIQEVVQVDDGEGISEDVLVQRSRNGDRGAYRILVERYQQKVYSLVFGVVRNEQDAEDVCQEAFVKAYLSLKNFLGNSAFYTWLYRIAYNMAIDFKRRLKRKGGDSVEISEVVGEDSLALADSGDTPEVAFERKQSFQAIGSALASLSEEHRTVVVLREVDGLSYEEISDVIGISKGTVMSRLHYARRKLQQILHGLNPSTSDIDPEMGQSDSSKDNINVERINERT